MKGYVTNIEELALANDNFRKVIYTGPKSQLVLMSLSPGVDIGEETHELDQFIKIESGKGKAVLEGISYEIKEGYGLVVPAGVRHNIINESQNEAMKIYTLYSPPEHKDGIIHLTKEDALLHEEHFDGKITEVEE